MWTSYKIDYPPENVLSLSGYEFSTFSKAILRKPEADILEIISVKTTSSFLLTENLLDIFNYEVDQVGISQLQIDNLCFSRLWIDGVRLKMFE